MLNLANNYQRAVNRAEFCLQFSGTNLFKRNKYAKQILIFLMLDLTVYYLVNISAVARYPEFLLKLYCIVTFGMALQVNTYTHHK